MGNATSVRNSNATATNRVGGPELAELYDHEMGSQGVAQPGEGIPNTRDAVAELSALIGAAGKRHCRRGEAL